MTSPDSMLSRRKTSWNIRGGSTSCSSQRWFRPFSHFPTPSVGSTSNVSWVRSLKSCSGSRARSKAVFFPQTSQTAVRFV